jgi:hypothetical protein
MARRRDFALAVAATVVVLAVLTLGFHTLRPLGSQRAINADERRVEDLRAIALQIFFRRTPPAALGELRSGRQVKDPITHAPYEYHVKSGTAYELCATFATVSAEDELEYPQQAAFWHHSTGRQCFQLDAVQQTP